MKKIISVLLLSIMLLTFIAATLPTIGATEVSIPANGMTFTQDNYYTASKVLNFKNPPLTFEANLKFSASMGTARGGIILGNYGKGSPVINFEIHNSGHPRLYLENASGTVFSFIFNDVNVYTGERLHLAIVVDTENVRCYIDGVEKQVISRTTTDGFATVEVNRTSKMSLGGDIRDGGNTQYFKGELYSAALFPTARTASEVMSDKTNPTSEGSLAYYLTPNASSMPTAIEDLSGYNYTMHANFAKTGTLTLPANGITFTNESYYTATKALSSAPKTFEATVRFPSTMTSATQTRGGVIIGNYGVNKDGISFEVHEYGRPRLYLVNSSGTAFDFTFDQVSLYNNKKNHVAIAVEDSLVSCYIDGVLQQSLPIGSATVTAGKQPMSIGGDHRGGGNVRYFQGEIYSAALYSTARNASQISADCTTPTAEGALAYYLTPKTTPNASNITDLSGNGYTQIWEMEKWLTDINHNDYAYTLAVVGDTQIMNRDYPNAYNGIYDWLVANKTTRNIQYVMELGDITDTWVVDEGGVTDTKNQAEWERAKSNHEKLENASIPYSLVRGNHDISDRFNSTFNGNAAYASSFEGSYDGKIENTWRTFQVGYVKYLLITLDYGAEDAILNWANDIIASHPDYNVIITTHSYLYRDGTTLDSEDECAPSQSDGGPNDGDDMWDKLVKKHKNISLVLSGHDPCDEIILTQTEGENGNTVSQLLIDPQGVDNTTTGGTGMVALLGFSEDGSQVSVEYYSTVKQRYFMAENQFSFDVDTVHTHNYSSTLVKGETTHWYECSCGAKSGETAHSYETTTNGAQHWQECSTCGYIKNSSETNHSYTQQTNENQHWEACSCGYEKPNSRANHSFDNACDTTCNSCTYEREITHDYTELNHSEAQHWYECSVCGAEQSGSRAAHSGGTATCQEQATCTDCNTKYGSLGGHSYDETAWGYQGEDGHAHLCTVPNCEEKDITVAHAYDNACDTACNTCGYTRTTTHTYNNDCDTTCNVCSATRTVTHNYTTKKTDATNHWYECSVCGAVDESTREAHEYDNACDTACNTCGYTRETSHNYEYQSDETEHWQICAECNKEKSESRAAHSGGTATCNSQAICIGCNMAYGSLIDHSYDISVWGYKDENGHAHRCVTEGCSAHDGIVPHVYGEDGYCTICGKDESKGTTVIYGVEESYIIVIPNEIKLNDDTETQMVISVNSAIIEHGMSLQVNMNSEQYVLNNADKNWTLQHATETDAKCQYSITSSITNQKVVSGDEILEVHATSESCGAEGSVTLKFKATYIAGMSGAYTDIITFTAKIDTPTA